jgi:ABC-type branched-subunit amino acid transport system substrate-binding protein
MKSRRLATWLAATALLAVPVAGCGSKGSDSSSSGSSGGVKTGPGVTADSITLGYLTDLSGVFAPLAKPIVQGTQQYWKEQGGKVCGRTVKFITKDHGYDPQKAVVQYRDLQTKVAGLQQLLGSPITAAILPSLKSDSMISLLAAWPSSLLPNDFVIEIGASYDIEMINGLSKLLEDGKIKKGDKIGHVYFEGEYGENGLAGSKAFADENGMEVVEQKIKATDEDMSGQVAALKRAGVKAIAMTTAPTQLASVAGVAASQGFNVPIVGNNPTYDPALLDSPAADAVKANALIVASIAPFNSDEPAVKSISEQFVKDHPKDTPKGAVQFGYVQGQLMDEILTKACDAKDLSREGIVKAARELSSVDTKGIVAGTLDYSKVGEPSERAVYLAQPADVPGGLKQIGDAYTSDEAKNYSVGG